MLKIDNGAVLDLESGTYSKLGTVTLNSTGNFTELVIDGTNVTLSGGTVTLSNNANNYIFGAATADTLTNQETISGLGPHRQRAHDAGELGHHQCQPVGGSDRFRPTAEPRILGPSRPRRDLL